MLFLGPLDYITFRGSFLDKIKGFSYSIGIIPIANAITKFLQWSRGRKVRDLPPPHPTKYNLGLGWFVVGVLSSLKYNLRYNYTNKCREQGSLTVPYGRVDITVVYIMFVHILERSSKVRREGLSRQNLTHSFRCERCYVCYQNSVEVLSIFGWSL